LIFLRGRQTLDLLCQQIRVGSVDIINAKGDAANADVVERRVGLALRQRIDELDQVEHGRVGIVAETHEDAAELFDLQASGYINNEDYRLVEPCGWRLLCLSL